MPPLFLLPDVPGIPVEVHSKCLEYKEDGVEKNYYGIKSLYHVSGNFRIESEEYEGSKAPCKGSKAIDDSGYLCYLLGEAVISGVFSPDTYKLTDYYEDRCAEDKGGKEEMYLHDNPDDLPVAYTENNRREFRRLGIGGCGGQQQKNYKGESLTP